MSAKIGRNESCPCGSGKKYCALSQASPLLDTADLSWRSLRMLESVVVEKHIAPYLIESLGDEYIGQAIADFAQYGIPERFEEDFERFFAHCILPWAVFNWIAEDDLGNHSFDHSKTIAENYLNSNAKSLNGREKKFIIAMLETYYSFYRVTGIEKDRFLVVKDAILKTEHRLKEKMATHTLQKGDFVAGRILNFEEQSIFIGMLPMSLPYTYRDFIEEFSEWVAEEANDKLTGKVLRQEFES